MQEAPVQRTSLAGVTIAITGVWRQFPASNVFPPLVVEQPLILSLQQPLYRDRSAGVDLVSQRNLSPVAGEEKSLQLPVSAGIAQVSLSNRINLNPGDLLAIQPDHVDLA